MKRKNTSIDLAEIPVMKRTITIDNTFMIADTLDNSNSLTELSQYENFILKLRTPSKINYTMILLCLGGEIKLNLNLQQISIDSHSLLLIPEGTIGEYIDISDNLEIIMIGFSNSAHIIDKTNLYFSPNIIKLISNPLHKLSTEECNQILSIYNIMRSRLIETDFPAKRELAINATRFILAYVSPNLLKTTQQSTDTTLFENFLELVGKHATSSRSISFYANALSITPRHLSRVIMRTSGKPVKQWINERIILEAKVLLNEPAMTIQQISDTLGFPNQSSFGTYFKKFTSVSPLSFRRSRRG